ncbi:ATP-dependent zinc metalloprotease FTSH 11, chloroplastic/mitochondrial-like [Quercus suber]|uniref:ATP-dependent zinc metalloprotease FTSH 11, chloroplastic/mitochondrial-like n=1 Tax=Quercus suber TaxID=58331 RepID=UPI0032DEB158
MYTGAFALVKDFMRNMAESYRNCKQCWLLPMNYGKSWNERFALNLLDEMPVSCLQNDNALLKNEQKELKGTIQSLLQSKESFVNAYKVEPKVSNKSRFTQELISTILFTIAVGLVWILGAAALQKYVGSLVGIGTSGVGSSSSYALKELNKEFMPEKNVKTFKDVKGCDDAKQELEEVVECLRLNYFNYNLRFCSHSSPSLGILLTGAPGIGKTLLAKEFMPMSSSSNGTSSCKSTVDGGSWVRTHQVPFT